MSPRTPLGAVAALALTVVLLPTTASAAPVFVDAATAVTPSVEAATGNVTGTGCSRSSTGTAPTPVPVAENGPPVSTTAAISATYSDTDVPADTATATATSSGTASITSAGGNPALIELSGAGRARMDNPGSATSQCTRYVAARVLFELDFTVTTPGFLTIAAGGRGGMDAYYSFVRTDAGPDEGRFNGSSNGIGYSTTGRVYLAPGRYEGDLEMVVDLEGPTAELTGAFGRVRAEFAPAGSQTVAVAGKGKKYVALPAARACAAHAVVATVSQSRKKAAAVKQVTFYVNGAKAATLKHPKKGAAVSLPVPDDLAAEVVAEVRLRKPGKGGKPRTHEVSASYEGCAA